MTGHSELLADFDGQLCVEPGNVDWRGTGRTAANTTPSSRPFATAAEDYLAAGYSPLPCENKNLKVSGKTGKNGAPVSSEDVSNWCRQFPEANIALRLPDDLMAIDVDVAGGSGDGAVSLQELVDELGYLPATWAATARQLPYGRYFFRVPAGTLFADKVKPKIDTLQHTHRYCMVWPTMHAECGLTRWVQTGTGENLEGVPPLEDIPELPAAWLERFRKQPQRSVPKTETAVQTWTAQVSQISSADTRKSDNFNRYNSCAQILESNGFTHSDTNAQGEHFTRPGKDARDGHSATVWADNGTSTLWSTSINAPDEAIGPRNLEPYQLDAHLNYRGDFKSWASGQPTDPRPLEERTRSAKQHGMLIPESFDDSILGAWFADLIADQYLYCEFLGGWMRYNGTHWARNDDQVRETFRQKILELGHLMLEADCSHEDKKAADRYRNDSNAARAAIVARRIDKIVATAESFDTHPYLLNCLNGTIDQRTGTLQPHSPADRLTQSTGTNYTPGSTHEDVDQVFAVLRPDCRNYLEEFFGYSATGSVELDLMPVFDGTGANGKTSILKAFRDCLGGYASTAPPKLLMKQGADEHPTLQADLRGRRLVTIEETAEGGVLQVETMKALSGGTKIKARYMRCDYFEFTPTHQLVIATNHRPAVNSAEHATWRRLRLIPFPYRYTEKPTRPDERAIDTGLRARLEKAPQREAMLARVIAGGVRWHTQGHLKEPQAVLEATQNWRDSEDVIHRFISDCVSFNQGDTEKLAALHNSYTTWCLSENRHPGSAKEFRKKFENHDEVTAQNVIAGKANNAVIFRNIKLRK